MAVISVKRNSFISRFKPLLSSQHFYHKLVEVGNRPQARSEKDLVSKPGEINISKWKKMDSRSLGISRIMVPSSPYTLLKILKSRGFEAYLVGGCVRDLLLNRTPKDFDVITTADLNQIKKQFRRCVIVGRRFPICRVHIKGSVIEVSSFKTLAKHSENKEKFLVSQMPKGCDKSDLNLWKNSMHRDFTVNSLFFDPINYKVYDYNNGMKDLLDLKLRTLVPAHLSFTEDCARILRGLRIAARLGLSLSKDIETAIHKQASSLLNLSTTRIMMEMDYMLSYGAAEASLRLLHRFNILEIFLPFQAAYISKQTTGSEECTKMLMKLFSHMDSFVSCGQPSTCILWIGILAFHQALVIKPQHPFVVLTFASVLYHESWELGLKFARKYGGKLPNFEPETLDPFKFISDDEIAKKVNKLAIRVIDSIDVLMDTDSLHKTMSKFPGSPCSGLVFISKNSAHGSAQLFEVLAHKVETYKKGRNSFEMNYELLGKGDASETRFALGKIILNTMGYVSHTENTQLTTPSESRLQQPDSHNHHHKVNAKSNSSNKIKKDVSDVNNLQRSDILQDHAMEKLQEITVSQLPTHKLTNPKSNAKSTTSKKQNEAIDNEDGYLHEQEQQKEVVSSRSKIEDGVIEKAEESSVSESSMHELICTMEAITENEKQLENGNPKEKEKLKLDAKLESVDQSTIKQHKRKHVLPLSSLFK